MGTFEVSQRACADEYVGVLHETCREVVDRASDTGQPTIVNLNCFQQPVDAGIGSILCAPIKTPERTLGALVLGRFMGHPEFTAGDGKLAMALAHQAAISMETARLHQEEVKRQRLEEELAIGRKIQLGFLPESCPVVAGWEFAAVYRPARQVGGDLYDFIQLPGEPGHLGMVIADVTGNRKATETGVDLRCSHRRTYPPSCPRHLHRHRDGTRATFT